MLVGVIQQEHTEEQVNEYLAELAFLAETAGAIAIKFLNKGFRILIVKHLWGRVS